MAIWVRDKSFYRYLLALALPIMLQSLISFGINFTDNLMVGTLGEFAISGVYLGSQIQGFLTMVIGGIEGAILVLAAQYWGRGDTGSVRKIVAIGVRFSVLSGLIFFLASFFFTDTILRLFTPDMRVVAEGAKYLKVLSFSFLCFSISQVLVSSMRSVESVRIGLILSIVSFVCNVVFNYVLIFGKLGFAPMGVTGAAIATLICRIVEAVIMAIYVFVIDKRLGMRLSDLLSRSRALLSDFLRYGLPILGGQVVWSINMMAQSAIIGQMGASAMSATSISNMLFSLVYVGMVGLSSAASVITGKTVGAGEFDLMKQYAKTIQLIFLGVGIVCGVIIFATKGLFVSLYTLEPDTVQLTLQFLTVLSFTVVGTSYQAACLGGLVKAGGDTGFVFRNDTIFVFLVVLPSAIIALFVFHAPAWVVFLCLKSDQILKCFVAVVKINRFKWMKNLTRDFAN